MSCGHKYTRMHASTHTYAPVNESSECQSVPIRMEKKRLRLCFHSACVCDKEEENKKTWRNIKLASTANQKGKTHRARKERRTNLLFLRPFDYITLSVHSNQFYLLFKPNLKTSTTMTRTNFVYWLLFRFIFMLFTIRLKVQALVSS